MLDIVVKFYQDEEGKVPCLRWIESIKNKETKARIHQRLRRLEIGNFGCCKSLKEGAHELKLNFGPGYRAYYGLEDQICVVLLCGGDKSTQREDIEKAKRYWKHFKEYYYETIDHA